MVCFFSKPNYAYKGTLTEMGIALGSQYVKGKGRLFIVTDHDAKGTRIKVDLRKTWTGAVPIIDRKLRLRSSLNH